MCRTTRRTQAAGHKPVSSIQPNRAGGKPAQAPPPNAFQGRPERVPQLVYVADFKNDGFLGQASEYYAFFGLEVKKVKSIHEMIIDLGQRQGVFERLCLVSHAHPEGMLLPMFTGAAKGTNKDLFTELAKSDLAGLLVLSPFSRVFKHLQQWSNRIDKAMKGVRTKDTAGVLKLFGLEKSESPPPAGDLSEFFFHCFDLVFLKTTDPEALTVKGAPLAAADRQTLRAFVGEVLNQLTQKLEGTSISGRKVKKQELDELRKTVTSMGFDDLGLPPGESFDLDVDATKLNSFPSLKAIVKAIQGGFRKELDAARTRMSDTTLFEIRGCRAAEKPEYLTSVGEFLGKPGGTRPTVTAPQLFQAYTEFMFDTVHDRKSIATWLSKDRRQHTPKQLRENLTTWAELIRVRPLHTNFWRVLFGGPAVRFVAGTWPAEIPKLFIPTPGLAKLPTTDIGQMISTLTNFFNVPKAAVPNATALKAIKVAVPSATAAAPTLLAPLKAPIAVERLTALYDALKAINATERQAIVPEAPPNPLSADVIAGFQKGLLDYFDEKPLAALKTFMLAAGDNLNEERDGLVYYLFFAGLPGFIFGPESQKNSIVVFTPLAKEIQQSWYRCIWADPLPASGAYLTAEIKDKLAHTLPSHVGDDRRSVTSVCPLPRYGHCIITRPLPPGEVDGPCGDISNP